MQQSSYIAKVVDVMDSRSEKALRRVDGMHITEQSWEAGIGIHIELERCYLLRNWREIHSRYSKLPKTK